jgi:hypothetical protein
MFFTLKQPYPFETEVTKSLKANAALGIFVALFLLVFQPFQINLWETEYKVLKIAGYGMVTFLVPTLLFLGLKFFLSLEKIEKSWTVGKEILFLTLYILGIAVGNTFFSAYLGIVKISPKVFLGFVPIVVCVGIFPVTARVLIYYQWYKEKNKKGALILESEMKVYNTEELQSYKPITNEILFLAENEKDAITLPSENIIYLESLDNYSKIVFINQKNEIQHVVLRGSLKRFESQISTTFLQRCHRSFIANLHRVDKVTGNAQGYKLIFKKENLEIPVSRNYGQVILSIIGSKKH